MSSGILRVLHGHSHLLLRVVVGRVATTVTTNLPVGGRMLDEGAGLFLGHALGQLALKVSGREWIHLLFLLTHATVAAAAPAITRPYVEGSGTGGVCGPPLPLPLESGLS